MPTRALRSPAQRAQCTTIPALSARDLARYATRSAEAPATIGRRRRPYHRLGFAVQLASLRFPGGPLQAEETVPPAVVATLAAQVGVDPAALAASARERDATRREHLLEVQQAFGFRPFDGRVSRELAAWRLPTAVGTDAGVAPVAAVLEEQRPRPRRPLVPRPTPPAPAGAASGAAPRCPRGPGGGARCAGCAPPTTPRRTCAKPSLTAAPSAAG